MVHPRAFTQCLVPSIAETTPGPVRRDFFENLLFARMHSLEIFSQISRKHSTKVGFGLFFRVWVTRLLKEFVKRILKSLWSLMISAWTVKMLYPKDILRFRLKLKLNFFRYLKLLGGEIVWIFGNNSRNYFSNFRKVAKSPKNFYPPGCFVWILIKSENIFWR